MPAQIIFPELSYQVMGVVFDLAKKLPIGLPEKDYQRGLALLLDEHKIRFRREVYIPISLAGKVISRYFADFVIDEKILLELKVAPMLGYAQARQVLTYLRASGYRLGIIVYLTKTGVHYRRIVNDTIRD